MGNSYFGISVIVVHSLSYMIKSPSHISRCQTISILTNILIYKKKLIFVIPDGKPIWTIHIQILILFSKNFVKVEIGWLLKK